MKAQKNKGGVTMALEISRDENGYIKVIERIFSWTGTEIKVVLYDMENNRSKVNNDPWYDMTQGSIDWVNKYYIPKLNEKNA